MNPHDDTNAYPPESDLASKVPYILALFVTLAAAYGGYKWWQVEQQRASLGLAVFNAESGPPITEFELVERSGEPFRSNDMRGRVWVATYFFTSCVGSCSRLNENIRLLHNLEDLQDVTWVSITCDPDTDTVEVLQEYANSRGADSDRWLFCRGDLDYVKRIGEGMFIDVSLKGHQDRSAVIDKTGKIRGYFNATSKKECQEMRNLLVELLAEPEPEENDATTTTASS